MFSLFVCSILTALKGELSMAQFTTIQTTGKKLNIHFLLSALLVII
jgi:hypothetical protein